MVFHATFGASALGIVGKVATFRSKAERERKSSVNMGFALKYDGDAGTTRSVRSMFLPTFLPAPPSSLSKSNGDAAENGSCVSSVTSARRAAVVEMHRDTWGWTLFCVRRNDCSHWGLNRLPRQSVAFHKLRESSLLAMTPPVSVKICTWYRE
jgi:hypothetical protein